MDVSKKRKSVYLGQYVVNLRIHQSSSVSVLGYTKNLGTNLKMKKKSTYNCVWKCLFFLFSFVSLQRDAHLRQRGCGYVHVTPRRHRQQWRNVWPAPVALGTVSGGRAPSSGGILPPRGLVRQMAERKKRKGGVKFCLPGLGTVLNAHFVSIMTLEH